MNQLDDPRHLDFAKFMTIVQERVEPIRLGLVEDKYLYIEGADKYVMQLVMNDPHGLTMYATCALPGQGVRDMDEETMFTVEHAVAHVMEVGESAEGYTILGGQEYMAGQDDNQIN